MARLFPLFLILSLILPAATPWAQTFTQDDYNLLGIKPPPPGFVDVGGVPDVAKVPGGVFPECMTVVNAGLADPGGLLIVVLRVPAERADEARNLMLDPAALKDPAQ
jgi:hypothetical protein